MVLIVVLVKSKLAGWPSAQAPPAKNIKGGGGFVRLLKFVT